MKRPQIEQPVETILLLPHPVFTTEAPWRLQLGCRACNLQAAPDAFAFILIVPQPFDRSGHGASIFYIQFQPNARFKNSSQ
jgi:hypothetical protein